MLTEIKSMRDDMTSQKVDTCSPEEALKILGFNNRGYLKYFIDHQLLNRRKGGKHFVYFKSECSQLAEQIRKRIVSVPSIREIFNYKN